MHCGGLVLADFGRNLRQFERQAKFCFCPLNNTQFRQFSVEQILLHLNTTASIGVAMKAFRIELKKF